MSEIPARRWIWPNFPRGLYEDAHGFNFDTADGGPLTRKVFDECLAAVDGVLAPVLLADLAERGALDLLDDSMAGVVATVWTTSPWSPSAMPRTRWAELFTANGFSIDGQPADRLTEPVRLYRGCVPVVRYFGTGMRLVDTDDRGCPVDPTAVVEIRDTRTDLAWTSNIRTARSHARRMLHAGEVYSTTVAPENLLAVIGDEHLVDPAGLAPERIEAVR